MSSTHVVVACARMIGMSQDIAIPKWIEKRRWVCFIVLAFAVAGAIASFTISPDRGPATKEIVERDGRQVIEERQGGRDLPGWAVGMGVMSISVSVLALAVLLARPPRLGSGEERRQKIDKLSTSLRDALNVIDRIKQEVADGEVLVARLEQEAETKGRLASLRTEEARAVLDQMRDTVRGETNRGVLYQLVINMVFFAAGVVVTVGVT